MKFTLIKKTTIALMVAASLPLLFACSSAKTADTSKLVVNEVVSSNKRSLVDEALGANLPLSPEIQAWAELGLSQAQKATLKGSGAARANSRAKVSPPRA